jgi:hypothetical protein
MGGEKGRSCSTLGEMINVYEIFVRKPEVEIPFGEH